MIVANKTLKHEQRFLSFRCGCNFIGTSHQTKISPRLFDGEAVDSQNPAQFIVGAVDDVLLLLVVQLLLDDVLAQVEHHLRGQTHSCMMGDRRSCRQWKRRGLAVPPSW